MNILLIKPCWPYPKSKGEFTYNRIWPPLSLMNCAALLEKEKHSVKILDAHAERIVPSALKDYAIGFDKIFVTSSSIDRWQCPNMALEPFFESMQEIKKVNRSVYIMGSHGTLQPERILNLTGATAIIRGEPEISVLEICRNKDLREIKGITFKKDDEILSNGDRAPLDMTSLPIPAFRLIKLKQYFYEILGNNFALFEISRGCPYSCVFCSKQMYGNTVRRKLTKQITAELTEAIDCHGVKSGYFIDLEFSINDDIMDEICDFLIKNAPVLSGAVKCALTEFPKRC